jgi:hypothetical protein
MKAEPTTPENLKRIDAMFKSKTLRDLLFDLKFRWSNEREFEDINDYGKVIASQLPEGFKLEKMTKSPFGFQFSIGTSARYAMMATNRSIEWKRLK